MKSEIFNQNKCGFFFSLLVALCFFSNNSQAQNLIESAKTLNEKIKTVDQNVTQNAQENIVKKDKPDFESITLKDEKLLLLSNTSRRL